MLPTFILIVIIIGLLVVAVFYSRYRMRKALRELLLIFRLKKAFDGDSAVTAEEIGIRAPSLMTRLMSGRDYRPYALQLLVSSGVVQQTEGQKYYLSETNLASSNLKDFVK